jgi:uncharacterized membrane protein YqjE
LVVFSLAIVELEEEAVHHLAQVAVGYLKLLYDDLQLMSIKKC